MALAVKPGYINPLSKMGQKTNGLSLRSPVTRQDSKASSVQNLQLQRQTLQNQMILLKSSSDGGGGEETQKVLEQQMEEVTADLQTAKAEQVRTSGTEAVGSATQRARFDSYVPAEGETRSPGLYQMMRDKARGYRVRFAPYSE